MKKSTKKGMALALALTVAVAGLICSANTVITPGDISVEQWIAEGDKLDLNQYSIGANEFKTALSNLKSAKLDYDKSGDAEYPAIRILKNAWQNLKFEKKSPEPIFKGQKIDKETIFALNYGDYSNANGKYIDVAEYSYFVMDCMTSGKGEYGNSLDLQMLTTDGVFSKVFYGGIYGSNKQMSTKKVYTDNIISNCSLQDVTTVTGFKIFLEPGVTGAEIGDCYGYRLLPAEQPSDDASLDEWIAAAEKIDTSKAYCGADEFKNALKTVKNTKLILSGCSNQDVAVIQALKSAWEDLKVSEKTKASLIESTSGKGTTSGFTVDFVEPIELNQYEKFEIAIDATAYNNADAGYGLSATLQFGKSGGERYDWLYQWFPANTNPAKKEISASAIINGGSTTLSRITVQDAKGKGYNINVKSVYGYKYVHAEIPDNIGNTLQDWVAAAEKVNPYAYSSGAEEFVSAYICAKYASLGDGADYDEIKAIYDLENAWRNTYTAEGQSKLPKGHSDFSLKDWCDSASKINLGTLTAGKEKFEAALKVAKAVEKGNKISELDQVENLIKAWNSLGKSVYVEKSVANSITGKGTSGGFTVPLKEKLYVSTLNTVTVVINTAEYATKYGGASLNIQAIKENGSYITALQYKWVPSASGDVSIVVPASSMAGGSTQPVVSVKVQDANNRNLNVTVKDVIIKGNVNEYLALPDGYENFTLSKWVEESDKLDLTAFSTGADNFMVVLNQAKSLLENPYQYKIEAAVSSDLQFLIQELNAENRKEDAYTNLKYALSVFKKAWRNLRAKETVLIAEPYQAKKNTSSDSIPDSFGAKYHILNKVTAETKYPFQIIGGISFSVEGFDSLEMPLYAANNVDGKAVQPEKKSCLLRIGSLENGQKDFWVSVPWEAKWGIAKISADNKYHGEIFKLFNEIGSDPITYIEFMSGYDKKSSVECDELVLGCIYGIKYNSVPYPKGALKEKSGANFDNLQKLVDLGSTFNGNDFVSKTWSPFKKALAQAKTIIGDSESTQAEIDAAEKKLLDKWGNLEYFSRVPFFDVADNIEWGLELADNLNFMQYEAVKDKSLPANLESYVRLTDVPSKWHKIFFRQAITTDTENMDLIEFYIRYTDKLKINGGCLYVQANTQYESWITIPSGQQNNGWIRMELPLKNLVDRATKEPFAPGTKLGGFSFTLSNGASGDIDITSANFVRTVKVEPGKKPVVIVYTPPEHVAGEEDFSKGVFNLIYDSANDGELLSEFLSGNTSETVKKAVKDGDKGSFTLIICLAGVAVLLASGAVVFVVTKKRKSNK